MEYEYQYLRGIGIFLTYKENVDGIHSLKGIISQAIPATIKLPKVQNAAIKLNIEPLFDLGWNSAKYDHITGPLPPRL